MGEIDLKVIHGVVKLMGAVPAFEHRKLAGKDARSVPGVAVIHDDLTVPPGSRIPLRSLEILAGITGLVTNMVTACRHEFNADPPFVDVSPRSHG